MEELLEKIEGRMDSIENEKMRCILDHVHSYLSSLVIATTGVADALAREA